MNIVHCTLPTCGMSVQSVQYVSFYLFTLRTGTSTRRYIRSIEIRELSRERHG